MGVGWVFVRDVGVEIFGVFLMEFLGACFVVSLKGWLVLVGWVGVPLMLGLLVLGGKFSQVSRVVVLLFKVGAIVFLLGGWFFRKRGCLGGFLGLSCWGSNIFLSFGTRFFKPRLA